MTKFKAFTSIMVTGLSVVVSIALWSPSSADAVWTVREGEPLVPGESSAAAPSASAVAKATATDSSPTLPVARFVSADSEGDAEDLGTGMISNVAEQSLKSDEISPREGEEVRIPPPPCRRVCVSGYVVEWCGNPDDPDDCEVIGYICTKWDLRDCYYG